METIAIRDACEVLNGYAFKSEKYTSSGIRIIRIANVQKSYIEDNSPVFYPIDSDGLDKYMLRENDLLVSLTGNVGRTALLTKDMLPAALNQRVACLRLKTNKITNGFLFHLLNSNYFESKCIQSSQGVAQKNMSTEWLKSYELPLYSLSKQNEITKILDDVRNTIILKEQELQKFDELIKARFVEMFGDPQTNQFNWNKVNISKIIKGEVSNGYFAKRNEYCDNGNVNILGVANIVNRMYSNVKDLPKTNANQKDIAKFKVQYGDMLFCRSSLVAEGIGKASIIPKDIADNILFECHVIRLPLDLNQCVPEFLQVLSTTDFFRNQVIAQSKTATMTTIGQDGILKTNIILPPIYKQKEFESFVQQVDKSKLAVQQSLEKTQLLFDSLMQEYFGEN